MLETFENLEVIPSKPIVGIYLLIEDSRIVYVGKSVHVISRVCSHRARMCFTEARVIRCDKSQLNKLERELIIKLRPDYNLQIFNVENSKKNSDRLLLTNELIAKQPLGTVVGQRYLWDTKLPGFYVIIGRRTKSYMIQRDIKDTSFARGRKTIRRLIGYAYGANYISVEKAREEAMRRIVARAWERKVWNPQVAA